ncbi:hypothetical protein [Pseudoalteromonas nigrifaciens]|nr:hypothetical protein [Pseudoalteromonas nigrifaciens]
MPTLINRNLTQHRGSPRIYLDDALLDELGVDCIFSCIAIT